MYGGTIQIKRKSSLVITQINFFNRHDARWIDD